MSTLHEAIETIKEQALNNGYELGKFDCYTFFVKLVREMYGLDLFVELDLPEDNLFEMLPRLKEIGSMQDVITLGLSKMPLEKRSSIHYAQFGDIIIIPNELAAIKVEQGVLTFMHGNGISIIKPTSNMEAYKWLS